MPNLLGETSGLMAFVRTVEAGTFSAAARDLRTTPSAVSKSVARLERRVGVRLFLRSTRALTLTQDGQAFFERVAPLLRAIDTSDDAISSRASPSGRLRISMPGELAPFLLPGLFADFASAYPDLDLDIGLTDRLVSLVREDYDVVLRVGNPVQEDLIVRHLADLPMTVVASPRFLNKWGVPKTPEALADIPFVRFALDGVMIPVQLADGSSFAPSGRIVCDSGAAMIEAAHSGLGAAYLMRCLVARELKAGSLVEVAPHIALPKLPFNALHAFGRTPPMRVRLLYEFVASKAKALEAM